MSTRRHPFAPGVIVRCDRRAGWRRQQLRRVSAGLVVIVVLALSLSAGAAQVWLALAGAPQ